MIKDNSSHFWDPLALGPPKHLMTHGFFFPIWRVGYQKRMKRVREFISEELLGGNPKLAARNTAAKY